MILIAPDKFKGTFSSAEIGSVIERYLHSRHVEDQMLRIEMADGGEGTAGILSNVEGLREEIALLDNPEGHTVEASYYRSGFERRYVIDSASFLGRDTIWDLARYNAFFASSYSLGRFIRYLINNGAEEIVIGVGGTMTTDGGAGVLQAMGYRFFDKKGNEMPKPITPFLLHDLDRIVVEDTQLGSTKIKALLDVRVPLLPRFKDELSTLSFAPQKGVGEGDMEKLEAGLLALQKAIGNFCPNFDVRNAGNVGAGGGLALALRLLNAKMIPGAEYLLDLQLHFNNVKEEEITHVYTGEGCFDLQSLQGKVTGTLINRFARRGVPVTIICGKCTLPNDFQLPDCVEVKLLSTIL